MPLLGPATGFAQPARPATRAIPATGETIPLVGLGTWITFNVGNDRAARDASAEGCGLLRRQQTPPDATMRARMTAFVAGRG